MYFAKNVRGGVGLGTETQSGMGAGPDRLWDILTVSMFFFGIQVSKKAFNSLGIVG